MLAVFLTAYSAAVPLATSIYRSNLIISHSLLEYFDQPEFQEQESVQPKAKATSKAEQPRGDIPVIPEQQVNLDDLKPAHDPQPGAVLEVSLYPCTLIFSFFLFRIDCTYAVWPIQENG